MSKANKVVLNGSNQDISLGFSAAVVGTSGRESIQVASGVDASITGGADDRILLTGDAADYTFTQQGSSLLLTSGGHTITLSIGGELRLIFADIEVVAVPGFTAEGFQLTVGEQVLDASFDVSQLVAADPSASSEDPNDPPAAKANKVILNGDDQEITLGFDASVVGTSGRENLICEPGVEANFTGGADDRLILAGNAADYAYQLQGSTLILTLADERIHVSLGGDMRLAFADIEVDVTIGFTTNGLQVTLGGQILGEAFNPEQMVPSVFSGAANLLEASTQVTQQTLTGTTQKDIFVIPIASDVNGAFAQIGETVIQNYQQADGDLILLFDENDQWTSMTQVNNDIEIYQDYLRIHFHQDPQQTLDPQSLTIMMSNGFSIDQLNNPLNYQLSEVENINVEVVDLLGYFTEVAQSLV